MKISTQPYKGARDFYPEDKAFQKWMFDKWRKVAELYGYVEYDAPILEPTDLYLIKGSQEIIENQTYTFRDRGDRSVTIRTEMTPSVSRMVAGRRQELAYPARWYSIPNLWRYERMQKGRLREFWQLNVDIFGVASESAELEAIQIIDDIFQAFKAKRSAYEIKINSRVLVNEMLNSFGLSKEDSTKVIRLIDRLNKMTSEEFSKELNEITKSSDVSKKVISILNSKKLEDLPENLQELDSVKSMKRILDECSAQGIRNAVFDISLMRGFDYYTDIVFEAFDVNPENSRSILGGGRYDGLVGQLGVEPVPTVGFAVGDVVFADFLRTHKLVPEIQLPNDVVILVKDEESVSTANKVARELRSFGVNTAVDYSSRKLDKQIKSADKSRVIFVVFVGSEEAKTDKFTLKNLISGKEEIYSVDRIAKIIKDSNN